MLGFTLRVGKYFKNPFTLVTIYKAHVRSHLEYASVIWNPHTKDQQTQLERVQHKFLQYLARRFTDHMDGSNFDNDDLQQTFNLESLKLRRIFADAKLVLKSFNGQIDSQSFIHQFHFHVPKHNTRASKIFQPHSSRTDVGKFSISNLYDDRMMNSFSSYCDDVDLLISPTSPLQIMNIVRNNFTEDRL